MNTIRITMSRLFLSCAEAARMISQACEEPLVPMAHIGLRLHLITCRHCTRYAKHVRLLHLVFRQYPDHLTSERLPAASVERIVQRIRRQSQDS